MKSLPGVVAVIVLLGLAWTFRERLGLSEVARAASSAIPGIELPTALRATPPATTAATAPPAGLRKCIDGAQTLYTNDACPAGSREQAVSGGALSVLPAPPAVAGGIGAANPPANPQADGPGQAAKDARIDRLIDTGRAP